MKYLKTIFLILITVTAGGLLTSCCDGCFLTRDELSGIKTSTVYGSEAVTIYAGDKSVTALPHFNNSILSYKLGGKSLLINNSLKKSLSSGDSLNLNPELTVDNTELKRNKNSYRLYDKNKLITTSFYDKSIKITKAVSMKNSTGDVEILERVTNSGSNKVDISTVNTVSLEPGGYIVLPDRYQLQNSDLMLNSLKENRSEYMVDGDYIVISSNNPVTLSSSGWFGYIKENMMLIISVPKEIKITFFQDSTALKVTLNYTVALQPNRSYDSYFKLIEIYLNRKIKNIDEISRAVKPVSFNLLLSR